MKTGIVTANDGLLLHKSPSKASMRLELIPMATQVEIEERETNGRWMRVKYQGIWGWAHADYLRVLDPEPEDARLEWPYVIAFAAALVAIIATVMLMS